MLAIVDGLSLTDSLNQVKTNLAQAQGTVNSLRVDFLAADVDALVNQVRALAASLDPTRLFEELDGLHHEVESVVASTKPSALLAELATTLQAVQALVASLNLRATLAEPLDQAWVAVQGILDGIDFTIILSPLVDKLDELEAEFEESSRQDRERLRPDAAFRRPGTERQRQRECGGKRLMADVTKKIHVRVMMFDPAQEKEIPVPDAKLLVEHDGWFYNPNLSSGNDKTGADGAADFDITFKDTEENSLNPFFTFELASNKRKLPAGAPAARQISLPDEWVTQHDDKRRIPRITEHTDPNNVLLLYYGLPGALHVSYTDFHPSGLRNPVALPAGTVRVHLADFDSFIFDILNPDDTLKGFGYDPIAKKTIAIGDKDEYPYF